MQSAANAERAVAAVEGLGLHVNTPQAAAIGESILGNSGFIDAVIEKMFAPGIIVGILSPLIAIPVAVALYIVHRDRIEPARRVPVLAYALALIVFGSVAGFAGMIEGMRLACPRAGNLCGLFGVFATGPISFSLTIVGFGFALFLIRSTPKS